MMTISKEAKELLRERMDNEIAYELECAKTSTHRGGGIHIEMTGVNVLTSQVREFVTAHAVCFAPPTKPAVIACVPLNILEGWLQYLEIQGDTQKKADIALMRQAEIVEGRME